MLVVMLVKMNFKAIMRNFVEVKLSALRIHRVKQRKASKAFSGGIEGIKANICYLLSFRLLR